MRSSRCPVDVSRHKKVFHGELKLLLRSEVVTGERGGVKVRSPDNRLVGVGGMEGAITSEPPRLCRRFDSELKVCSAHV